MNDNNNCVSDAERVRLDIIYLAVNVLIKAGGPYDGTAIVNLAEEFCDFVED